MISEIIGLVKSAFLFVINEPFIGLPILGVTILLVYLAAKKTEILVEFAMKKTLVILLILFLFIVIVIFNARYDFVGKMNRWLGDIPLNTTANDTTNITTTTVPGNRGNLFT